MLNSGASLAQKTRIMFTFLLIPLFGGIILYASGEEQTVSAIAEKHSSTSQNSLPYSTSKLPAYENVTLATGDESENGVDSQNNSTLLTPSSSVTQKNTETTDYEKISIRDSTSESTPSTKYSTGDSLEFKSTENYKVSSSDIDYGGYNSEKSATEHINTRKSSPEKSKNEFAPSESATVILSVGMTVEGTVSSNKDDESLASTVANSSPTSPSDSSSVSDVLSVVHSTTAESEDIPKDITSSPQKVSASPKRATKKRSLNSTNLSSGPSTLMQTSPSLSVTGGTTSPSLKVDSFDTKVRLGDILSTPLTHENQNGNVQLVTSTDLPLVDNSPDEIKDGEKGEFSMNETHSSSTVLIPNTAPVSTEETDSNVSFKDSEILTEAYPMKDPLNSFSVSSMRLPTTTVSHTSSSEVFSHEVDDIIYAGFSDEPLGATFDPDGMRNDLPQDPDSIIFSVPPKNSNKLSTEKYTDSQSSNPERETMSESLKPAVPYHDLDDLEFVTHKADNASEVFENAVSNSNFSESLAMPEIIHYHPSLEDTAPMIPDTTFGHDDSAKSSESDIKLFTSSSTPNEMSTSSNSDLKIKNSLSEGTDKSLVDSSSDYVHHQTDQSVIRPVKVISPTAKSDSSDTLLQSTEFYTTSSSPDIGSINTQNNDSSNSMVQSSPSPTTVEKPVENSNVSTTILQPGSNSDISPTLQYDDSNPNSTITGIAIKTSVSVSLPISKIVNGSQEVLSNNASESSMPIKVISPTSLINKDSTASTLPETSVEITTNSPSTTDAPFKIRIPGIRVPGMSDSTSVKTRKPYVPPALKRASTTAGPPVSIFKKSRTRANSITSSTTAKPFPQFSTIRIHYASHLPGLRPAGEMVVSVEPITTTVPPTTTTEEPISEVPFTDQTYAPSLSSEDQVILVKVGGGIVLKQGLRWSDQLGNRNSPEYKEKATQMLLHLEQLFRSSPIATQLARIEIDGFNGTKVSRPVEVDFILYLIKSPEMVAVEHLAKVFHEKLSPNNTFARYRVDTSKTAFEFVQEELMNKPTPSPEDQYEPPVPQWAIAVIVICAASLIFIVLFAAVTMYGRHHMRRRYGDKLKDDELDRSSGEWESKMTAAYENMAADTIYDAEDLPGEAYKKSSRIATFHGIPSTLKRCDSWSSGGWSTPPRQKKPPHVH